MVAGGIKAIWNFSTVKLKVPSDVLVQNVDLSVDLVMLSQYIQHLSLQDELSTPTQNAADNSITQEF